MPIRLSKEKINDLLQRSQGDLTSSQHEIVHFTDVFIAGSGPISCTYARHIIDNTSTTKVYMAEIGSQDNPVIGAHHKNSIKFQKDIDKFVNIINGALQPISISPSDTYQPTLAVAAWAPPIDPAEGQLVIMGHNPNQEAGLNLPGSAVTRTVGGMATHWTCACPTPHDEERVNNPVDKQEFDALLERAKTLLNVHSDQYDDSIRQIVVKETLQQTLDASRGVTTLPLGVERRTDNPIYVTWTGADTVLGDVPKSPRFALVTETRVTKLIVSETNPTQVVAALLRNLNTSNDELVVAKSFVIACGAVCTPQILWNSNIRPYALGRYLSEQSMTFCQIVLKRGIVDAIATDPRFAAKVEAHKKKHPDDVLPIPFHEPEPQVMIPYTSDFPWHVQVHRDAFSYGDVGPKADPRVVVDLRFFGKSDIVEENRVTFGPNPKLREWEAGVTDTYGMPQPTFHVKRTNADGDRDQRMMNDMTNVANMLGGYLPGSYPQFMAPGLVLHITGTTRIGTDDQTSVADPTSKVHNFNNLWVGGNGCIPDATACNPTRTSVAYALKGAEAVVNYLGVS